MKIHIFIESNNKVVIDRSYVVENEKVPTIIDLQELIDTAIQYEKEENLVLETNQLKVLSDEAF